MTSFNLLKNFSNFITSNTTLKNKDTYIAILLSC